MATILFVMVTAECFAIRVTPDGPRMMGHRERAMFDAWQSEWTSSWEALFITFLWGFLIAVGVCAICLLVTGGRWPTLPSGD